MIYLGKCIRYYISQIGFIQPALMLVGLIEFADQGVLQAEMEKVLLKVKPYLKEKNFTRYRENINN